MQPSALGVVGTTDRGQRQLANLWDLGERRGGLPCSPRDSKGDSDLVYRRKIETLRDAVRAYAIFDGGGVKGAALAGALKAAENSDIEFVGFGGTSAGSIIALLASVGYTGEEIQELLVDKGDFCRDFLDDKTGDRLRETQGKIQRSLKMLSGSWCHKALNLWQAWKDGRALYSAMFGPPGIYSGAKLQQWLSSRVREKLEERFPGKPLPSDFTFQQLEEDYSCKPLKVVVSDITDRKAVVFSKHSKEFTRSAIRAVQASASYPFVFKPVELRGTDGRLHRLVDGGLASNLPCFLYNSERAASRDYVLAFDLISSPEKEASKTDGFSFCSNMLNTALEAGDELQRGVLEGVHHIPIRTPANIDTLDFNLQREQREALFHQGYAEAASWLSQWAPLKVIRNTADGLRKASYARFGPPNRYEPILRAVALDLMAQTDAKELRTCLILPTDRGTYVTTYFYNMPDGAERNAEVGFGDIRLHEVWAQRIAVVNLQSLREAQANAVSEVPVERVSWIGLTAPFKGQPSAILTVDSTTPLEETGWTDENGVLRGTVLETLCEWANLIDSLMPR